VHAKRLVAANTYLEVVRYLTTPNEKGRRARLLSQAASLYEEADSAKPFFENLSKFHGCNAGEHLSIALALLQKISLEFPSRGIFRLLNVYFHLLFRGLPRAVSRRLFRLAAEQLVNVPSDGDHVHLVLIPLLATVPPRALDLQMMVEVADGLHRNVRSLSFKPNQDLSLNYIVDLNLSGQTILSFAQIDDIAETAAITTILALFFLGFQVR
jgi:hypothetical protein